MIQLSLPLKSNKIICLRYQEKWNSDANNINLSKTQFYEHNQNKQSFHLWQILFCSVRTLLSWFYSARHFNRCVPFTFVLSQKYLERKPSNLYPARFSHLNYVKPLPKHNECKYGIPSRAPFIWNNFLSTMDKRCR